MKRRSSTHVYTPQKHRRNSGTGASFEIKDGKDGVVTRCQNSSCREVTPICFAELSKKCARSDVTSRWVHVSVGEHYCAACSEEISRPNGPFAQAYRRWLDAWTENSKSQPSYRLFIAEEILPYWAQCNFCEKWRCLPNTIELNSQIIANFSCQSHLRGEIEKDCSLAEDLRVKAMKDLKWMETLSVPPLIKHSPAALFLYDEYYSDGVGMSPSTKKSDIISVKIDSELINIMNPFYQPNENGKAMCIRPDVMEYDEVVEFPEYARVPVLYLGLRNLIVALWNLNPTRWLTPEYCMQHLVCRGMVRILCSKELMRILTFLNRKGIVNYGVLRQPSYSLLGYDLKKMKVIVVGAGISGLAAARQLENFGAQVTVLEARSRIGGRVCDDFMLGVVVGRGAQLVTGVVNNPITIMSVQVNQFLTYDRQSRTSQKVCLQSVIHSKVRYRKLGEECPLVAAPNGLIVPIKTDKRVDFHFNAMLDAVEDWRRSSKNDESLHDSLNIMHGLFLKKANISFTTLENQLLDFHLSNLEYSCGASLTDVSSLHWDQNEQFAQFAGEHALMIDGCSTIIDRLAEGLDVRTEFEVLVTLPLAVLQWQAVEFVPQLPDEKLKSIKALGAGIIEKIALRFPTKFWHKINGADYFGNVPDSVDMKNLFTIFYDFSAKDPITNENSYVLMSYLSGKCAKLVRTKSDEEIIELAMRCLRRLFPEEEVPDPENYFVTHWWEDPCSGMSYSYVKVGSSGEDYDVLARELEDKLYFAGEATNRHFPQTITGAYLSGLREASKIATKD